MFKQIVFIILTSSFCLGSHLGSFGLTHFDGRIVGGEFVDIQKFPHQVSLQYNSNHRCGGSIISLNKVLTAAHCVYDIISPLSLKVRVGSNNIHKGGQLIQVDSFEFHEKYDTITVDYDVAIITLKENLVYTNLIAPIQLANRETTEGSKCIVSGFGNIQEGGPSSELLRAVEIKVISRKSCRLAYNDPTMITDRMMCAGIPEGNKGSCQGDSGGPLMANGKIIGIVSWAYGCARPETPTVFADVPSLLNWINARIHK